MKTVSIREFFRQPKLIQEWVRRGERVAVARHDRIVFEVHPPSTSEGARLRRKSVGRLHHLHLKGDPTVALPLRESWK